VPDYLRNHKSHFQLWRKRGGVGSQYPPLDLLALEKTWEWSRRVGDGTLNTMRLQDTGVWEIF
jgi:hypothetical protein